MESEINKEQVIHSSSWFSCCSNNLKVFSATSRKEPSFEREDHSNNDDEKQVSMESSNPNKPGGWRSMPFILGNETFERLASFGIQANFMVYLRRHYHMDQVAAVNLLNIFAGVSNFGPLFGAFLSDAFIGRFWAIAIGSVASFLGMFAITFTAWIPSLTPPWCPYNDQKAQTVQPQQMGSSCIKPTGPQVGFLLLGLGLLSIGTSGIRPCSIPFGMDQFDHTTEEGRRGINSYYNWYYTTFTIVVMLTLTVVVYIQDQVSWIWGFGIPTALMFFSILLFFFGMKLFVYIKPEGSIFSSIFRVFVAAYKKRGLELPHHGVEKGVYYNPPPKGALESVLPLTTQYRLLNKAAIIQEGELTAEGAPTLVSKWSLCSIQEVEQVKCVIRVLPIWASGIICFTSAAQQSTFTVSQAMIMNRNIGPKFQIPPGSIGIISMLAIGVWVPIYDRFVVPFLRKVTKQEDGLTLLQRMGIGLAFSTLSMVVAGLAELKRRNAANVDHKILSVMWLAPQLVMLGLAEGFNFIAQIEFYNKQFPENLRSMATSMFFITIAGANYLSTAVVSLVHQFTGEPNWLTNDLNQGRVDYFYYLLAVMGVFNFIYFVIVARKYKYKGSNVTDVELNQIKH